VSIKAHVGWAMLNKHLIMYLHIRDIWSPTNLVGSMVAELDDTPPNITGVQWDSVGPPTDAHRSITWKTCSMVRWAWLDSLIVVVNCGHSWCLHGSHVSCSQVISLVRLYIHSNLRDTLKNG
jgi:hypothetical protein